MKNLLLTFLILMGTILVKSQEISNIDSTGLPGDNLDLGAVLDLFKRAKSPEDFESLLNSSDTEVNNLDLNEDGKSDYIGIYEYSENNSNVLVLRVNVNENESQDVAVIAIEKNGDESARLQIIGDEAIYGSNLIAEPFDEKGESKGSGPFILFETQVVIVNVWTWPAVRFIYGPIWKPWRSPYYWGNYPNFWKPWRPIGWRAYRRRVYGYRSMVIYGPTIYVKKAHKVYGPHKVYSPVVKVKYAQAHSWHKSHYKTKAKGGKSANPALQNGKAKGTGKAKQSSAPKSKSGTSPKNKKRR